MTVQREHVKVTKGKICLALQIVAPNVIPMSASTSASKQTVCPPGNNGTMAPKYEIEDTEDGQKPLVIRAKV